MNEKKEEKNQTNNMTEHFIVIRFVYISFSPFVGVVISKMLKINESASVCVSVCLYLKFNLNKS